VGWLIKVQDPAITSSSRAHASRRAGKGTFRILEAEESVGEAGPNTGTGLQLFTQRTLHVPGLPRHQAVGEQAARHGGAGRAKQAHEVMVIGGVVTDAHPRVAAVQDVVAIAACGGWRSPGLGGNVARPTVSVKRNP